MAPFFDPSRCPVCAAPLPLRPLRCPTCGVELTGPTVVELVTTLRRADILAEQLRTRPRPQPRSRPEAAAAPEYPAQSWFTGRSVGVILLILGALCVVAAGAVFVAVAWVQLPLAIRTLVLVTITAGFGLLAQLALRRGLQATAEAMTATALAMLVLDLAAARSAGLPGLADLAAAPYQILSSLLLVAAAGAAAYAVRSRQRSLWTLDAGIAFGVAGATVGALRLGSGTDGYAVSSVTVTVFLSLLFTAWRRLRLPVAMWVSALLGATTWLTAMAVGAQRAADHVGTAPIGDDLARVSAAWPALAMALVAGAWSIRMSNAAWLRRATVAACLCLLPVVLVFEIVGWSHGWVAGTVVMLAGYVIAARASRRLPMAWSLAARGSTLVLGLSALVGVLPTMMLLAERLEQGLTGRWPGEGTAPLAPLTADVSPWLIPLATVVILTALPQVTTAGHRRFTVHWHHTVGALATAVAVVPIIAGADFLFSIASLAVFAVALISAARIWRTDLLLTLGMLLLAIMRICAYADDLADPLAWTLITLATAAIAMLERRSVVSAGFLTASGLSALFAAATWLVFLHAPRPFLGLVIVVIGSLGLLASQRLPTSRRFLDRSLTRLARMVGEGVSVTWLVAGLTLADRSPSHRALELTVAGVALGITGYLSPDRHRAGWVSGMLLTTASWVRLMDLNAQSVEWYTLPAAAALLVYGTRRLRRDPAGSTWRTLGPGLSLALTPSLWLALDEPLSWRGLLVGLASAALLALGAGLRLAAPFALGGFATGLLALRNFWPLAAFVPRWTLLFLLGALLLATGMTWESRVNDVRTAGRYVRGLR